MFSKLFIAFALVLVPCAISSQLQSIPHARHLLDSHYVTADESHQHFVCAHVPADDWVKCNFAEFNANHEHVIGESGDKAVRIKTSGSESGDPAVRSVIDEAMAVLTMDDADRVAITEIHRYPGWDSGIGAEPVSFTVEHSDDGALLTAAEDNTILSSCADDVGNGCQCDAVCCLDPDCTCKEHCSQCDCVKVASTWSHDGSLYTFASQKCWRTSVEEVDSSEDGTVFHKVHTPVDCEDAIEHHPNHNTDHTNDQL